MFNEFLDFLNQKYNLKSKDIQKLPGEKEISIPVSIFNEVLSPLESIVKYMKDNLNLSFDVIAKHLFRTKSQIVFTYKNSNKRFKNKLDAKSEYSVPISVFSNLKLSVLESIVKYMKETEKLSYHNIAVLLKRDDRTVWTIYSRCLKKNA
ncbi:MAG: hypothetical protein AABW58_02005 [Nanoarchaeota archaeon]